MSPLKILFNKDPVYTSLKTFGCLCFPDLRPYNKHKFSFKSSPCTFLGYSLCHKGYKCMSNTGRIYIARNVIFNESHFPFAKNKPEIHKVTPVLPSQNILGVLTKNTSSLPVEPCVNHSHTDNQHVSYANPLPLSVLCPLVKQVVHQRITLAHSCLLN